MVSGSCETVDEREATGAARRGCLSNDGAGGVSATGTRESVSGGWVSVSVAGTRV